MISSKLACRRKSAYSKKEADAQLLAKYAQKGWYGAKYLCSHCGWWHITKRSEAEYRKEK